MKFLFFFGMFWSAMTLLSDGLILTPAIKQIRACSFSQTTGKMVSNRRIENFHDDGTTYGVAVEFQYSVDGRSFQGNRYRYNTTTSSDCAWANAVVSEYPDGKTVVVYYDPKNPQNSLLEPGLNSNDWMLALCLTPFNAVMIGLIWYGTTNSYLRRFRPIAGGVRIIHQVRQLRASIT